ESLLQDLMKAEISTNVMIEIPAFMAGDTANIETLQALHKHGNTMLLKGRPVKELPREILPCFKYSIIELSDDRRAAEGAHAPGAASRSIPHVQSGISNVAEMEASFTRGAAAVLGWPIDDAVSVSMAGGKPAGQTDLQVIVELINRVDK